MKVKHFGLPQEESDERDFTLFLCGSQACICVKVCGAASLTQARLQPSAVEGFRKAAGNVFER